MKGGLGSIFILAVLLFSVGIAFAQGGYGTSAIVLSKSFVNVSVGGSATVGYTVQLATGSTWGTAMVVTNAAALQQQGITVAISNPSGDPPFSGVLTVITSQTTSTGSNVYKIILAATGDDPSQVNAVLNVSVGGAYVPTTTTAAPGQTTTVSGGTYYPTSGSGMMIASTVLMLLIAAITIYLAITWKTMLARLAIIGTGLILIGTVAWIYGDYAGGLMAYVWGGVAAIAVGTLVWIYGDVKAETFKQSLPGKLALAGIALIVIGTVLWLYADYYAGSMLEVWIGVALIVVGTAAWLYGEAKAGAFLKAKDAKKK